MTIARAWRGLTSVLPSSAATRATLFRSQPKDLFISYLKNTHKFFRYMSFKIGRKMSFDDHDYSALGRTLGIGSVMSTFMYYDLLSVARFAGIRPDTMVDSPSSSLFVERECLYDVRSSRRFRETYTSKDYIFHSVIFRLRREWNVYASRLHTCCNFRELKSMLLDLIIVYE